MYGRVGYMTPEINNMYGSYMPYIEYLGMEELSLLISPFNYMTSM